MLAIAGSRDLIIDPFLLQIVEFVWYLTMKDIYTPPALFEFPNAVETLPLWMAIGPSGAPLAHELGHALAAAFKYHADKKPDHQNESFYYTEFTARHPSLDLSCDNCLGIIVEIGWNTLNHLQ